ncbi:MAG: DNA polymerase ligase N-terminal domain-containing protein, partial [Acidimicrobiales bacterium]
MAPLDEYRSKRDFDATPEPAGDRTPTDAGDRFVIQQHDATRLHWDLRLERDGVLASWAVPRGIPWSPKENHLAVHTEDHPLEYLTFAGDIPEGEYGAGHMFVWDTGTYEALEYRDNKAVIVLHGERARGKYALFQTRGRDWMIHRMDPPEDPAREFAPDHIEPMAAKPGRLPSGEDEGWAYEILWSGLRVGVRSSGGVVIIRRGDGTDVGASFPEVRRLGRQLGITEVILDGVITGGEAVERRLAAKSESAIRRLSRDQPVALVVFDLLWLDGHPTGERPWEERRSLLDELHLSGPAWRTPSAHRGEGQLLLDAAGQQGLAGLVAKR